MPLGEYSPPENRIVHYTSVDFSDRNSFNTPVYLVQRDTTLPIVAVSVMKDGVAYPIPAEADVNICWKKPKPDVHYVYSPCLGADPTRTIVYFEVEQQMTVTYGEVHATLEIQIGMLLAGSASLPIFVEKNPIQDEDMESSSEAKTILDYVGRAETAMTEAKQSATDSEASASRAEAAKNGIEEALSQTESARDAAEESARKAEEAAEHPPRIQEDNDHWWIWDKESGEYVDSGIDAGVSLQVVDAVTGEPGTAAKVENLGTATDPILQFTIPVGADGKMGFSPTVEITKEGKDNIVTITAEDGPHTFTVRDGEASVPDNLIVGEDGDIPGEIVADADTLEGHPAEYFASAAELAGKQDALPYYSNPNLLDNWYFVDPVNQRGRKEYTETGYTIDRWAISEQGVVKIGNGCIEIIGNGQGTLSLVQPFERTLDAGVVYTISVLTNEYGLLTASGTSTDGKIWAYDPDKNIQFFVDSQTNSKAMFFISNNTTVHITACKLERGDTQTLAHKEGNAWVLNEVPDYATELAKCQRYYQTNIWPGSRGAPVYVPNYVRYQNMFLFTNIFFPVTMRAVPSVKIIHDGVEGAVCNILNGKPIDGLKVWAQTMDINGIFALQIKSGAEILDTMPPYSVFYEASADL